MEPTDQSTDAATSPAKPSGFRRAVFRGLGVVLPPLLTIVVLLWAWKTIESYVLKPTEWLIRSGIVMYFESTGTHSDVPEGAIATGDRIMEGFTYQSERFVPDPVTQRRWLPEYVVAMVDENAAMFGDASRPPSANAYWHRYVQIVWMPRWIVLPVFLTVFITLLYFLGRLFTFGLGRWFVRKFDDGIMSIPLVNKVYGSVKQVTDFAFNEREIEFNRVVAIEYPRKGIWSLGFVTGNSMREISEYAGEPMLSVLMPTSPMPMTGFTVTVPRSEAIDIDLTIDEAIQFVVSCGVVVAPHQRAEQAVADAVSSAKQPAFPTMGERDEARDPPPATT